MASRFADLDVSVDEFIEQQENENTKRKTEQNLSLLNQFLSSKNEKRSIEDIPSAELNLYLSEFIIKVRTKQNKDYEPNSLRGMIASFERHLKKKNYGLSIMKNLQFEHTRKALVSKQKDLKRQGKGNKPRISSALSEDDIAVLYEKDLLGTSSPEALLNTLWFNNTIHFGLRGCKEHRDMTRGDVKLHKTAGGEEYLEYNEKQTKTRSGENTRDVRKVTPKMFSVPGNERDPIAVYKLFAEKRPAEMNSDDSPFYLAANNLKKLESLSNKAWFKKAPAGVNKLNSIMKNMAEKAGLTTKFTNHSERKTMMQTLVNQNFPPTDIIQLSGHKNLQSVTHYSTVNESQQMEMSRTLSSVATGNLSHLCNLTTRNSGVSVHSSTKIQKATSEHKVEKQHTMPALFSNATIRGGSINISINTLKQSPTLSITSVDSPPKTYKRLKLLSDSESD